jgi:hypothetical protein
MSFQHVASKAPLAPLELQAHREKAARLHPEPGSVEP